MDIHGRPLGERVEWLFDLARRHSAEFSSPEAFLARHPTAIAALKCLDGRINIPFATRTPIGLIQPFRNLGGMFDLGWPHLGEVLTGYVLDVVGTGRRVLVLITYHFSRGDPWRGCAGFANDTAAARAHAEASQRVSVSRLARTRRACSAGSWRNTASAWRMTAKKASTSPHQSPMSSQS